MKNLSLFFCLLCMTASFGQSAEIDNIQRSLPHLEDSLQYIDAVNRLAILMYEKNVDSTFYYAREARAAAERLNYARGKAGALNNLGAVFDIKGDLQLSLRYYNDAYNQYCAMGDSANITQLLMNMALVFNEMGEDTKAVHNLKRAIDIGHRLVKDSIVSLVLANFVSMYPDSIGKDTVRTYIAKTREIAQRYHDERVLVAAQQLEALQYLAAGDTASGIALLREAAAGCLRKQLFYLSIDMLRQLGDLQVINNPAKAETCYLQGLALAEEKGYHVYSKWLAKKLFNFYTARKDTGHAQQYSAKLVELYDTEEAYNRTSGIDYMDYALKDQALEAATLTNESRKRFNIALSVLCLLAAVTGLLIYRQYRAGKKQAVALGAMNKNLRKALEALEQSQQENTRMMKIVAHDLRSPVGAIVSFTEWMMEHQGEDNTDVLPLMHKAATNALTLISELLHVKLSATDMQHEPVDVTALLQYCVGMLQPKATEKSQEIILEGVETTITGDREKLWRVFSNLVNNAIKFSPPHTAISISMSLQPGEVVVCVRDKGIGIPAALQSRLFDMGPEIKRKGTAGEPSFGLGLSIAKQIVEAHSGRIWINSKEGAGTSFFVALPVT